MNTSFDKSIIVTALYDIGRSTWDKFSASYHTYLHWGEAVLSIDSPIVVFTEEKFFKPIFEIRRKYDRNMDRTKIIVQPLHDSKSFKLYYEKIDEIMRSNEFKEIVQFPDVPEMCKPLYTSLIFNKLSWMSEVYNHQYIENDIVIWKDFGVYRDDVSKYANVKWPDTTKINNSKVTFFSHHDKFTIKDYKQHILSQNRFLHGGCVITPGYLLQPLEKRFHMLATEMLNQNYTGSEEKLWDIIVSDDIGNYNLVLSDWREYWTKFL